MKRLTVLISGAVLALTLTACGVDDSTPSSCYTVDHHHHYSYSHPKTSHPKTPAYKAPKAPSFRKSVTGRRR